MTPYVKKHQDKFIGREEELRIINELSDKNESFILAVYGRRRIGKTFLIEHALKRRNLLKFEGLQTDLMKNKKITAKVKKEDQEKQFDFIYRQLGRYIKTKKEMQEYLEMKLGSWTELFEFLAKVLKNETWTLYFEEVQWLSSYSGQFFAELKEAWDNLLTQNKNIGVVLSGSSPSYIMNQLLIDKALYGRSLTEIHLQEFSLKEIQDYFSPNRSLNEIFEIAMLVGGVPEYLKKLKGKKSLFLTFCQNTFLPSAYFLNESDRIFISSMSNNKHYQKVIKFLSQKKYATLNEIKQYLGTSSGSIADLLDELEQTMFINRYHPVQLIGHQKITRYHIADSYLQFYFKFIDPIKSRIKNGDYKERPLQAIKQNKFSIWLGFTFERWCRKNHTSISKKLGFSAVEYKYGAFFNRSIITKHPGFQIDLMFIRKDKVITICEIKYCQKEVGVKVINEVEDKIELLLSEYPEAQKYSIERVLISNHGASKSLLSRHYFDFFIKLEDFLLSTL